jgi:putative heme-binding domain-containing protein
MVNLRQPSLIPVSAVLLTLTAVQLRAAEPLPAARDAYRKYATENTGDTEAGERLFRDNQKLACTNCHRVTGVERSGPNLAGVADKFTREELIQHVLEPSASVKPGYEQVNFVTQDGRAISGRLIRSTKQMFRLIDAKGKSIDLERSNIDEMQVSTKSMMPDNLMAEASKQEFADLVAYLATLRFQTGSGLRGPADPIEMPVIKERVQFHTITLPAARFANPVWCGGIPGLPGQMAVVEHQEAKIWRTWRAGSSWHRELFLDLSKDVKYGNNWGLMCLAFHPDFGSNRRYFLEHEVEEDGVVKTIVVERTATAALTHDSGAKSRRLLELEQPAFNHNGGCIAFGPDKMLYAAFGDGGPQRDPNGYSQNTRIYHGSMIRIDVDQRSDDRPYSIPPDNPFVEAHQVDRAIRPETWAIGFREPWRFSFDSETGDLWLGDVGQDEYEEVCLVRCGDNHGWNVLEAYQPFSTTYFRQGEDYVPPVFAYHHRLGVSVTGGHVYRGQQSPSFVGVYVFGDYETRRVWGLAHQNGQLLVRELGESPEHIASFGTDDQGEIYLVGYEGSVFHIDLSATKFE